MPFIEIEWKAQGHKLIGSPNNSLTVFNNTSVLRLFSQFIKKYSFRQLLLPDFLKFIYSSFTLN